MYVHNPKLYNPASEGIVEINDDNFDQYIDHTVDGEKKSRGLIPRNFSTHGPGCYSVAPVFSTAGLLPETEWASRLRDQQQAGTDLFVLREMYYDFLQSLDQDGFGYCWMFSTVKAMMYTMARAQGGLGTKDRLSAWMGASIVKNYRDEGGWGAESLEFVAKNGIATLEEWPQGAGGSGARKYDTPEMRANAAKRKITEWWDGTESRSQNTKIMVTAFLLGLAPVLDFNWWSHSVCGCRLVSLDPLTIDIDNSWSPSAGTKGIYRLTGNKAIPDSIVVPRVRMAA